jgi:hypothetical protein
VPSAHGVSRAGNKMDLWYDSKGRQTKTSSLATVALEAAARFPQYVIALAHFLVSSVMKFQKSASGPGSMVACGGPYCP